MTIPDWIDIGAPWKVLAPGIHEATFDEVERRFATNPRRKALYDGFRRGCESLESAGCCFVLLDGSYVTNKPEPGDFDSCWDASGVNPEQLDPELLDFTDKRRRQHARYGGEFFPVSERADGSRTFVEYFKTDKETGKGKGIVLIRLA